MRLYRPALSLLACALALDAAAVSCGDTITSNLVLTADLHCTSGYTALYVPVPGVTIDLNGHTLSGDVALGGIELNEADGTVIKGPGVIKGFWVGVNGVRSDGVTIHGVDFADLDVGVALNNSDHLQVDANRFRALRGHAVTLSHLAWAPGGLYGGHRIADNLVEDAGMGFQLCGAATGHSKIEDNILERIQDYGIHLEDGSAGNVVAGNRMAAVGNTGLVIRGSNDTRVYGNVMKDGRLGIALIPQLGGLCGTGGALPEVRDTVVEGNTVVEHEGALTAGLGLDKKPRVYKNRINGNKFYYDGTGILFLEDAHHNDGTGNAYAGTTDPVIDFGYGNAW